MSRLSEEEIVEDAKQYINNIKELLNNGKNDMTEQENIDFYTLQIVIQGLLDLYNKEKEKREIAEENYKVLSLDLGQALKELGLYEDTIIADELVLEINKRYISKDKIKGKIEILNTNIVNAERFDGDYIGNCRFAKYILQELLEERN